MRTLRKLRKQCFDKSLKSMASDLDAHKIKQEQICVPLRN